MDKDVKKDFLTECESDRFYGFVTKSKSLEAHEMKKSNLNLSYHEQDGVLLPNICILISRRTSSPSEDTAAWRLLICTRTTRSGMPS